MVAEAAIVLLNVLRIRPVDSFLVLRALVTSRTAVAAALLLVCIFPHNGG